MWAVPVTFVLVMGSILGIYWTFVIRPESASRESVSRRLRAGRPARESMAGGTAIIKETPRLSSIPTLDAAFARAGSATGRAQRLLDSADLSMSVGKFVLASLLAGVSVYLVASLVFKRPGIGVLLGLMALCGPMLFARYKRSTRFKKFEEQFPEAIELIARAMRAGHGLSVGLGMVAEEMPQPVGREFRLLYDWQNFGMSLPDALHRFADRVPLLDARFFVTAVLTQRESGGNLAEVLDNLAKVIRDRFRVKRQIRVLSAHGRITGAVLSGMPPALAFYFLMVRPSYLAELINDPLGVRMVFTALFLQVAGMLIIRRLVDIEY